MSRAPGEKKAAIDSQHQRRLDRHRRWMTCALVLSVMATATARASPPGSDAIEIHLRYHRQDLTSPAAARRLLERIGNAALEVCGASTSSLAEVKAATRESPCWRDAVDRATRRVGSPTLSALVGGGGQ